MGGAPAVRVRVFAQLGGGGPQAGGAGEEAAEGGMTDGDASGEMETCAEAASPSVERIRGTIDYNPHM